MMKINHSVASLLSLQHSPRQPASRWQPFESRMPPEDVLDGSLPLCTQTLEFFRRRLGEAISYRATEVERTDELVKELKREMPAGFPKLLGKGSTREVWELPLGLVLKAELPDPAISPLPQEESKLRGGPSYTGHLWRRRRMSNYAELTTAIRFPSIVVPIYGVALSFGAYRTNPGILIAEKLTTLDTLLPDQRVGIAWKDLGIDRKGEMHCFDRRLYPGKRRPRDLWPLYKFPDMVGHDPDGVWLGNLGLNESGRLYFADRGNSPYGTVMRDRIHFCPWNTQDIPLGSAMHRRWTREVSKEVFALYLKQRQEGTGLLDEERRKNGC